MFEWVGLFYIYLRTSCRSIKGLRRRLQINRKRVVCKRKQACGEQLYKKHEVYFNCEKFTSFLKLDAFPGIFVLLL